ncbi:hypothetical protein FPV67DRAFT_1669860 [Lyophyllum atratum]|nr:hypothetical protein FPV67DRAFT_1669860 [Lyophyllum atratum]
MACFDGEPGELLNNPTMVDYGLQLVDAGWNTRQSVRKTKEAVALLQPLKAYGNVIKFSNSRKICAASASGPLVIYNEDNGIFRAFRDLLGVELVNVGRLNLLQLAHGGNLGCFIIWTEVAFTQVEDIYGTFVKTALYKKHYIYKLSPEKTELAPSLEGRTRERESRHRTMRIWPGWKLLLGMEFVVNLREGVEGHFVWVNGSRVRDRDDQIYLQQMSDCRTPWKNSFPKARKSTLKFQRLIRRGSSNEEDQNNEDDEEDQVEDEEGDDDAGVLEENDLGLDDGEEGFEDPFESMGYAPL